MTMRTARCAECGVEFILPPADEAEEIQTARCPMCRRLAPAFGKERGIVKWFNRARAYGFITPVEGSDLFLHQSGMAEGQPLPRAGQLVEFARTTGARGVQAVEVMVLEGDSSPV